jgi:hypothetical protein
MQSTKVRSLILPKLDFITMDLPVQRRVGSDSTDRTAFVSKEEIIQILSQLNFTGVSYQATISNDVADTSSFLKEIFDAVVRKVTELGLTELPQISSSTKHQPIQRDNQQRSKLLDD